MDLILKKIDPFMDKKVPDLSLVPISITYEKLIEAEVYTNELLGEQKTKEVIIFFKKKKKKKKKI